MSRAKHLVGGLAAAGALSIVVGFIAWYTSAGAEFPPEFHAAKALQTKAFDGSDLTEAEVEQLIELSRFQDHSLTQARAISGLGRLGNRSAESRQKVIDAVCAALEDPNPMVVSYAAASLGELGAVDKADLLKPLLEHEDYDVKRLAKRSLAALEKAAPTASE